MFLGMPVLWRYLIGQFLKVLIFSSLALVLCLLTLRMEEMAHFASLDATQGYLFTFILYQIPYILPIAIPLASLISAMILISRLSSNHEISAMRSLGFSLTQILQPILIVALLVSSLNFYITSELATLTHFKTTLLKAELRSVNPLLLLHNKHLLRVKGIFYDALGATKMGELASDVVLAYPGKKGGRMNFFVAKKLEAKGEYFEGKHLTLISDLGQKHDHQLKDTENRVLVENMGATSSRVEDFSSILQKKGWSIQDDYLGFKFLLLRLHELNHQDDLDLDRDIKNEIKTKNKIVSEIARRLALGFAPFCFTMIGLAFGLSISRKESKRGIVSVTILAAFFLITFFLAKGMSQKIEATLLLYTLPPFILIIASLFQLRRINKGIE